MLATGLARSGDLMARLNFSDKFSIPQGTPTTVETVEENPYQQFGYGYGSGAAYGSGSEGLNSDFEERQTSSVPETVEENPSVFTTERFGDLEILGVTRDGTVQTDQGDFKFYSSDYINKGTTTGEGATERQTYSKAFIDPTRKATINDNSIAVDLADLSTDLYQNTDSSMIGQQGILVPADIAFETISKAGIGQHNVSEYGRITGLGNGQYNLDASGSTGANRVLLPGGSADTVDGVVAQPRYEWPGDEGGMFSGIPVIGGLLNEISDGFANIEDITREGIEGVDAALQNKYVRAAMKVGAMVLGPGIGAAVLTGLDAYATLDSGEELSAGDIAGLAIAGAGAYNAANTNLADGGYGFGNASGAAAGTQVSDALLTSEVQNGLKLAAGVAEGGDPTDVFLGVYGDAITDTIGNAVGEFTNDVLDENFRNTVIDVAQGQDPLQAVVGNYGDTVADKLNLEGNARAGALATGDVAVALDQGLGLDEAAVAGASKYVDEGGDLGNLSVDGDLFEGEFGGLDLDPFDLAQTASEALALGSDVVRDAASYVEDVVSEAIPGEDFTQAISETVSDLTDKASDALASVDDIVSEAIPGEDLTQAISETAAAGSDVVRDAASDLEDAVSDAIGDGDIPQTISEAAAQLEDAVVEAGSYVDDVVSENLPEFDNPFEGDGTENELVFDDVFNVKLPDVDLPLPSVNLAAFAGLFGGGQGQAPTLPSIDPKKSLYKTEFNFLQNVDPLGMLGNFSKKA